MVTGRRVVVQPLQPRRLPLMVGYPCAALTLPPWPFTPLGLTRHRRPARASCILRNVNILQTSASIHSTQAPKPGAAKKSLDFPGPIFKRAPLGNLLTKSAQVDSLPSQSQ